MALKVGELYGELKLDKSKFDRALATSGGGFGKFVGVLKAGAAVAATAIGAIAVAAGAMAVDFETKMANVETLLEPGKGVPKRMEELGDAVKNASVITGKSLDDISSGLYDVIGTFGDTADSAKWVELAAKSGAAGLATTEEAFSLLSAVTKAYGDESIEAGQKVADLAFQTANLGVTTLPEMAQSMGRVTPSAAALGVEMEELFAVMATLTGVTGSTDQVTTQLRGAMTALQKPSREMAKALEEIGYTGANAGKDIISEKGLVGAIRAITETSVAGKDGIQKLFRNTNTLNAIFALTGKQADDFDRKLVQIADSAGATDRAFEIQQKTVEATMKRVWAAFSVVLVGLGEKFLPVLEDMLNWVLDNMPAIQATFETTFDVIGAVIGALVDIIGPIFEVIADIIGDFVNLWKAIFGEDGEGITATRQFTDQFAGAGEIIVAVINGVAEVFAWIGENVIPALAAAFNWISENILPALRDAFNAVVGWVKDNWPLISKIVGHVLGAVGSAFHIVKNIIGFVVPIIWGIVEPIARVLFPAIGIAAKAMLTVIEFVYNAIGVIWQAIADAAKTTGKALGKAFEWLGDFFSGLWDGITDTFKGAINFIIDLINGFLGFLNNIHIDIPRVNIPGTDIGVGGGAIDPFNIPLIPHLARGARNFRGGLALVGEAGPELVRLPPGSDVFSNRDSERMMDGKIEVTLRDPDGAVARGGYNQGQIEHVLERALLEVVGGARHRALRAGA